MMEGNGVFRQTALVHTIYVNDVTKISGNGATAVRPGAQVNNVSSHPSRGDIPLPPRDANVRQGGSRIANMEREEQAYQDTYAYERARPGRKSFSSESNSGSYCLPKVTEEYYQQNFGSKWTPKPIKFIHRVQDPADETLSKESFLQDVDKSLKEFESSGGKLKKELEEVILLQVLPYLEESWGKSSSQKMDAYVILAKLSSCRSCSEVVRHALQQLQYLLFRDNLDSCKESLLKVEKIVRSSIISPDAVFKEEADSAREVRLSVYKRILSLICIYQIQTGFSTVDFKDGLKKLQQDLKHYCTQIRYKKKNYFRYSMEFIQGAISYLLKGSGKATATNLGDCLDNCLSLLENQESDVTKEFPEKLKKIVKKVKTGEWFDLHCVLCYLHGKVHSERPTPEMCIERQALILLRRIVEAYQEGGGGDDWRFCLLAGSLLSDIAMNNMTKELRIEAGGCMINLLRDKRLQKKPECRVILESLSSEMLFNPDHVTKTLFAGHLLENRSLQQPLPEDLHVQHLTNRYRNQTLEINKPTISQGQKYFVKRGMFQRNEVIVKICNVTKQDILESESPDHSGKREKIISEAYNLRRLRCFNHPNIAVLLGCNTKSLPYHVITEFEKEGNLLRFVQASRWDDELLPTRILLKMLLDVIEALLFLENRGLVHRAVMAENILVGDDCRCKLGGMHALRQLQKGYAEEDRNDDEMYDYCSSDDCCLDVVCHDDGEESVRWKAPECILKKSYSTASDVWAFGVLMYEVFTYGCRPYRNIRSDKDVAKHVAYNNGVPARESCFQDEEFTLMTRCWERHRSKRIALASLKERLEKVLDVAMDPESEEKPRDDPPPLETCIDYTSCQSDEKGDDAPTRYDAGKDGTFVMEKITNADKNHLRRLFNLNTPPDLVRILRIENLDYHHPVVEMISPEAPFGNLKDYVLSKQCQLGDIVTFLSQVTSALHFLHSNHIVHGDLRAEYVNVIAPNKVQVTRLGRSLLLPKRAYDNTSASCVVQRNMPPDATRWSAPEVIQDGNYTHASDVWAFAVLGWELYTAFATGQEFKEYSVPYCNHAAEEVIHQIRNVGPLSPPDNCPDWVYIVMHQCWAFDPVQRPPFIAIFDCLTTRQPMNSWLMSLWKERHEKSEWPDSSITQPENACHITNQDKNCLKEIIEQMCNDGYKLSEHDYRYVQENAINRVAEEFYDDLPVEKCSKTSSDVIEDECYEDISPTSLSDYDFEGKRAESPTDSNTSSTEPRYQNVKNFGIKKIPYHTEEEELYDDIDNIRHQNISTVNTLVVGEEEQEEAETYDDISEEGQEFYEDIEERSRDPCHGACANEPSSKDGNSPLNTESQEPSFEEDIYSVDEETDPVDPEGEDLYEEIDNLRPPSYAKACNETEQANVDSKNASCLPRGGIPRGGVPSVNEVEFLYEEIGGNQTTDSAAYQSTTGPQDHHTTNNRDEAGYRELSQRESYMQLTRPTAKKPNPAMKNAAKLNNRRLPHKRKETINDRLRNTVKEP